jgi:hypothetical protein
MAIAVEEMYGTTQDVAVNVKVTRIIFKCKTKGCKQVWAKEYRKVFRVMPEEIWSKWGGKPYKIEAVYDYLRIENGRTFSAEDDCQCSKCDSRGEPNIVVGKHSDHVCDARCMSAKNGACECSCGGANHGINHL